MRWVVVGAGSAGCVVTRRLVDAGHDVVLVEAGPRLDEGNVPASIDGNDALAALGEPGRTYRGLVARRIAGATPQPYWRGRGVGGSSAVNGMVARWGSDDRYRSWGWDDIDALRARVLLPVERPASGELGRLDRLVLQASSDAGVVPLTRHRGRRVTSAEAYLWPVADRLRLVIGRHADRITLDGSGAPTGVLLGDGSVIVGDRIAMCAGAIHTPAILLRSGIGDGVGTGLADHPAAGLVLKLRDPASSDGLVTATTIEAGAVQMTPLNHLGPDADADLAMLSVALLAPAAASGTVTLASDDPGVHPLVDLDLLSERDDVELLASAVEAAIDLVTSGPISEAVDRVFIDDRGTGVDVLSDRTTLVEWLRGAASGYVHASCSCAGAVADDGRVRGHDGLTIADASAFSQIPDANLQLPTTLLAERFVAAWIDAG